MADADAAMLSKAKNIIVYAATWGEGDPPQRAADFYKLLLSDAAPRIDGVRFAVLALGDTAYVNFCQTGKEIDARLEALGGVRAADRVDLDLDFAKKAAEWTDRTLGVFAPDDAGSASTVVHVDFKESGCIARGRRAGLHSRQPARCGDRLFGEPQRHRLDARDVSRRDRQR